VAEPPSTEGQRMSVQEDADITKAFSDLYWLRSAPWMQVYWRGARLIKCPPDLWTYSEIIFETKPRVILETGTHYGGSALYFADLLDILGGQGHVYTVECELALVASASAWKHARITHITGDSLSDVVMEQMRTAAQGQRTMVSLDSAHTYEQVSAELALYGPLVSPGCYLVCEDTNLDVPWQKPAAHAAVMDFVASHPNFEIDKSREKHLLTFNPDGWLRRTG
jgi:cephalosporin hydroxylase